MRYRSQQLQCISCIDREKTDENTSDQCFKSVNNTLRGNDEIRFVEENNENIQMNDETNGTLIMFDDTSTILNTSFDKYAVLPIAKFNTSQATLQVLDLAARSWDGKLIIQRVIVNPARSDLFISQAFLRVPFYYNETLDTARLVVDHEIMDRYWAILASPPFLTGSLLNQRDANGSVVVIGLGAGQLNNYLHFRFPKLHILAIEIEPIFGMIAKKYFGFNEDATQSLIIMDGIQFLTEAASEGKKYDAIYIDACPSVYHEGDEVLCPSTAFLDKTNIQNMKLALSHTGTVIIKMLLITKNVSEKAKQLSEPYQQIFENCAILPMTSLNNRLLVCTGKAIKKLDVERFWNEMVTFHAADF